MISRPLAALREATKVRAVDPLSPSETVGEERETVGGASSSVIVPVAVPAAIVAFVGERSFTETVSSGSSSRSPMTDTAMVLLVSAAAKVRVPLFSAR